jgi:peptidoglycan biosynthesis protein MviN/MurJ (putative lipid II flippase)
MGTLGGVLSFVTLIGCLAAPLLIYLFAPGFRPDPYKFTLSGELLRWTFPYLMFISLTSMVGGILNVYGRFAIPAFTPVILNVCLIASAFIQNGSVEALAYSVFAAGVLQFLFQLPSLRGLGLLPKPQWGWHDERVQRILRLMGPVVIGSTVAQFSLLLNLWAYGAGIIGFSLIKVLVPGFYARGDNRPPVRYAITGLVTGMAVNVCLFVVLRFVHFPAAHVGLATSTSLTAWINALLLLAHLRRHGIYQPAAGWGSFLLRVLLANAAMSVLLLLLSGSLDQWIAMDKWQRVWHLVWVIGAAVPLYFGALYGLGLRLHDFRVLPSRRTASASDVA